MVLVLDANILVRAVLGRRVFSLLHGYRSRHAFAALASAFDEATLHIPSIQRLKRLAAPYGELLRNLRSLIAVIAPEDYRAREHAARERLRGRDEDDWPVLAAALTLNCPVWTEDYDFFGTGVPTWTSDRVEIFLRDS
jgi:predicted nucleic acid-binding protein